MSHQYAPAIADVDRGLIVRGGSYRLLDRSPFRYQAYRVLNLAVARQVRLPVPRERFKLLERIRSGLRAGARAERDGSAQ